MREGVNARPLKVLRSSIHQAQGEEEKAEEEYEIHGPPEHCGPTLHNVTALHEGLKELP